MLEKASKGKVRLGDGLFRKRMELDRKYLLELDSECLLQNYYLEAGIQIKGMQTIYDPEAADIHWGWESPTCQLRGHFLGHWLSAAAKLYAYDGDVVLKEKLDGIVSELERCQKKNGGEWVGAIPEKYFDIMAGDEYIWSPQYTMHKLFMGLIDAYKYADNEKALGIADRLADWYIKWAERMKTVDPFAVYKGEQAGMLGAWVDLYSLTDDEKYLGLIELYKDNALFRRLMNEDDALSDDHANASIPLSHGAARMYELTGEDYWKEVVDKFWQHAVTDRGMFATGSSNAGEFWIPKKMQGTYMSDSDQEFCTVYNMVVTADYLLRMTGDKRYADHIERALYNGFLAQQNSETGMPAYFLPMRAGGRKKWGSKTRDFWCCHGTMVQAQTIYPELIYYTGDNTISVMQYIPSEAEFVMNGERVKLRQKTEMKNYNNQVFFDDEGGGDKSRWSFSIEVECENKTEFTLRLRMPEWAQGCVLSIDGEKTEYDVKDGCIELDREWENNKIMVMFASKIRFEHLPDCTELAAAVDGPIVLAGLTDRDSGLIGKTPEDIFSVRTEHTYGTFVWKQNNYVTKNQPVNIEFKPLYDITDEQYTIYFTRKD